MMENQALLKVAYVANIVILVPVCWTMFFGSGVASIFENTVPDNPALRTMVGSLWAAILAASIAGLFMPAVFAPVLLIQVFYKALWLGVYVAPLLLHGKSVQVPVGISTIFLLIVLMYPIIFWKAL
jgi:hypothetical protein